MSRFQYVATNVVGNEEQGVIDAPNPEQAAAQLRQQGLFPTDVKPYIAQKKKKGSGISLSMNIGPTYIRRKELTILTRQLATLLEAGLPLIRAVRTLAKQSHNPIVKKILEDITASIEAGGAFSEALSQHPKSFDQLYVSMIRAGEASGKMAVILKRLAIFMEKSAKVKGKVSAAMVYPIVVMTIAVGITATLIVYIVPKFSKVFEGMMQNKPLPFLTQMILNLSQRVADPYGGGVALAAVILLILAYSLGKKTARGRQLIDKYKCKIPLIGSVVVRSSISRVTRTLGTLLGAGVSVLQALKIVRETAGNEMIAVAIGQVHDAVKEGEGIASPLRQTDVFPEMVVSMAEVGEETGQLAEMMDRIADTYDDEVDNAVSALTSLIEPLLIVGMAVVVGTIVVALFLPLMSIMQNIR